MLAQDTTAIPIHPLFIHPATMVWHGQTAAGVGQTATGVAAAAAAPTATGVARPATGVAAAAAAPTATGVARPAPATEEELLTIGWPCDWPPSAARKAGALSKATAWCTRLQLQGDMLAERLPPRVPPKTATGVTAKSATGVVAKDVGSAARRWLPPAPKAATRERLPPRVPPKTATGVTAKSATGVVATGVGSAARRWDHACYACSHARKAATRRRKFKALSRMTHVQAIRDIRYFTKVFKAYLKKLKEMKPQHWDTLGYKANVKQWRAVVTARRRRAEVASSHRRSVVQRC
jgi:hypothetical protein